MDLVNYEQQTEDWFPKLKQGVRYDVTQSVKEAAAAAPMAKYGQPACPSSPNACYCTGQCNNPKNFGTGSNPANAASCMEAPTFVQDHNAEEVADKLESQQILRQAKQDADFYPLQHVLDGLESILRYKNKAYGNSGLLEVGVLSKASALEKLLARADDKIARIKNSSELRKNDVCDLMGYLVLICAKQGWNNFSDQQD